MSHPCTPSENCNFTRLNGGRNDLGRKSQKFTIRLNNTISLEHFFSCSTDFFLQQPGKCDPFCATCPMGLMCSVSIWLATVLLLILLLGLGLHRNTLIAPPFARGCPPGFGDAGSSRFWLCSPCPAHDGRAQRRRGDGVRTGDLQEGRWFLGRSRERLAHRESRWVLKSLKSK